MIATIAASAFLDRFSLLIQ